MSTITKDLRNLNAEDNQDSGEEFISIGFPLGS